MREYRKKGKELNIEILISVDGEQVVLNDELNSTINVIVNSYIKQKISGVKPAEKKVKAPRDPNKPKQIRTLKAWTLEEIEQIKIKAQDLANQEMSTTAIARNLAVEFGRSPSSLTNKLYELVKNGELQIKEFDYKQHLANIRLKIPNTEIPVPSRGLENSVNAFKQANQQVQ